MSDDNMKVILTVDLLLFAASEMKEGSAKAAELRETAAGLLGALANELKESRPDLVQKVLDDLKSEASIMSMAN